MLMVISSTCLRLRSGDDVEDCMQSNSNAFEPMHVLVHINYCIIILYNNIYSVLFWFIYSSQI